VLAERLYNGYLRSGLNVEFQRTQLTLPNGLTNDWGHELISQIVDEYVKGTSTVRLAARYGIGKGNGAATATGARTGR
jgi:hypothetical protein